MSRYTITIEGANVSFEVADAAVDAALVALAKRDWVNGRPRKWNRYFKSLEKWIPGRTGVVKPLELGPLPDGSVIKVEKGRAVSVDAAIEAMRCVEINFCSDCQPCSDCGEFGLSDAECCKLLEAALPHLGSAWKESRDTWKAYGEDAQRRIDKAQEVIRGELAYCHQAGTAGYRHGRQFELLRKILAGDTE